MNSSIHANIIKRYTVSATLSQNSYVAPYSYYGSTNLNVPEDYVVISIEAYQSNGSPIPAMHTVAADGHTATGTAVSNTAQVTFYVTVASL